MSGCSTCGRRRYVPCAHLTVDEGPIRRCIVCGLEYDRGEVLDRLRELVREQHRLPPSPWSAFERVHDLD